MKPLRLLVAIAALALLGGAIWYSEKHPPKPASETETPAPVKVKLLAVKEDQIGKVRLVHPDTGSAVELEKDARGAWSIREPKETAADDGNVKSLVSALAGLESEQVVAEKTSDWASFGLDQPKLSVEATLADGKKVQVDLGADAPTGSLVYARVAGGDKVYGVSSYIRSSLDKSSSDLRDKRLLRVEA